MRRTYHSYKPFIDLFLLLVAGLSLMFMLSFMLIRPDNAKVEKNTETKAEINIVVTWPDDSPDDVDTYVEDPMGHLVYFSRLEDGLMALERDDQGFQTDRVYYAKDKFIEYKGNREVITIRGLIPGDYTVNVHMYTKRSVKETPVYVVIDKLNPKLHNIAARTVTLTTRGDEKTVIRFAITEDGKVTNVREETKILAQKKIDGERYDYYDQDLRDDSPDIAPDVTPGTPIDGSQL